MDELGNASVIGRLLDEISWEGSKVRAYRQGGRGMENVLTAEVLLPLSYLPREAFLGDVLSGARGATAALADLARDAESAEVSLLPGDIAVGEKPVNVQPDATITTASAFALVEAKRIPSSSFQPVQLAREYLAVLQEAGARRPVLLLVLGAPPPVRVKGHGLMEPSEAIQLTLSEVHRTVESQAPLASALEQIADVLAWITWSDIANVVRMRQGNFADAPGGLSGTVHRLCASVLDAVAWHS